ncbi:uncharacterized protein LOC130743154 isoform X2 [Lotus japonicus]|uniref:uncharacterized protein LOC130743154 isoform X2 n=1 Tax=Lotus japonicus TaxID=34305 RepID=UPI00258A7DCC|nr:uncharacterized protein LOC130743154 isoform X2 [Lotus japonicus]XP_057451267.1 uncharacterized protein LOC130743154 isoform X2 [Lotus japonicus]XP_057451268.1 uncharacterized protein LOC130743154 isoform X2 [Lotus japonicus]
MDKERARQARMRRMIIMKNNRCNRKTTSIQVDENTTPLHKDPLRIPLNYNDEALKYTEFRQGSKPMRSPLASLDSVQNIIAGGSSTQQSSLSNIQTKTTYQKIRKRKGPIGQRNNVFATYKAQVASYARLRRKAIMKNKSKMNNHAQDAFPSFSQIEYMYASPTQNTPWSVLTYCYPLGMHTGSSSNLSNTDNGSSHGVEDHLHNHNKVPFQIKVPYSHHQLELAPHVDVKGKVS